MQQHNKNIQWAQIIALSLVILAASTRFIDIPGIGTNQNFTAIGGLVLLTTIVFKKWYQAALASMAVIFITDFFIQQQPKNSAYGLFYGMDMLWVYASYAIMALVSKFMNKKANFINIIASGLVISVLFFLITNFSVWNYYTMYSKNFDGLIMCYKAGIPFFKNFATSTIISGLALTSIYKLLMGEFKWKLA
jgi:hypothetical protein